MLDFADFFIMNFFLHFFFFVRFGAIGTQNFFYRNFVDFFGVPFTYFCFVCVLVAGVIFVLAFVPESKDLSPAQLEALFGSNRDDNDNEMSKNEMREEEEDEKKALVIEMEEKEEEKKGGKGDEEKKEKDEEIEVDSPTTSTTTSSCEEYGQYLPNVETNTTLVNMGEDDDQNPQQPAQKD